MNEELYSESSIWNLVRSSAEEFSVDNPLLSEYLKKRILSHETFSMAIVSMVAECFADNSRMENDAFDLIACLCDGSPEIITGARFDLLALLRENASIPSPCTPILYFPGYKALQCHRVAHAWWKLGYKDLASHLQYRVSCKYSVDIHPAASIGSGIFIDHAAGIVVGETAVIEDDVTIFQGVTLGGIGKLSGDRHPKVRKGAFLGAGAIVLGNIEVGGWAKIGAGAIVTKSVPPNATMLCSPANELIR